MFEDWEGGAGNGLGTLYAYQKAVKKNPAVATMLAEGKSVTLYHTAGKGTRLAPLPGSENNNKPGVKLSSSFKIKTDSGEEEVLLTILEAVILQTSLYADRSKGRLSVYWGDQVFIPSEAYDTKPTHHADILAQLGPAPPVGPEGKKQWTEKDFSSYGLICVKESGDAIQVEKAQYEEVEDMLKEFKKVGVSLGSFSVSTEMLEGLLKEFEVELDAKEGKFDTDPDWWMPFTLSEAQYVGFMTKKKRTEEAAKAHYTRMNTFKAKFCEDNKPADGDCKLFGAVGIGPSTGENKPYWWDYGQLKWYQKYNLMTTHDTEEARALRSFLKIVEQESGGSFVHESVKKDEVRVS